MGWKNVHSLLISVMGSTVTIFWAIGFTLMIQNPLTGQPDSANGLKFIIVGFAGLVGFMVLNYFVKDEK